VSAASQFRAAVEEDAEWEDLALEAMEWAKPEYRRGEVDWSGRRFAQLVRKPGRDWDGQDPEDWTRATTIINNWRAAHAYPLNTFQATLRSKARKVDPNAIVAQRTKRLWSIWHKLDRFKTMQLSQMQDVAGIRAIVATNQQAFELLHNYQASSLRHSRKVTDYTGHPRSSGYRGIHVIWKYLSEKPGAQAYNGLLLEMQIRSSLQHTWATTVETMGTLTRQALKSSLGDDNWLRFFSLMGSVIALREGTPPVPQTPSDPTELLSELRTYADRTCASFRLRTIGTALRQLEENVSDVSNLRYFLLELTPDADTIKITGFTANQSQEAQSRYTEVEKRITTDERSDAVLVSVDSIASLRRAYPNYFLDTGAFADLLEEALSGLSILSCPNV
jgi:ppGpp synthetase/RelA/SpoT-type nucleotidyltranferase